MTADWHLGPRPANDPVQAVYMLWSQAEYVMLLITCWQVELQYRLMIFRWQQARPSLSHSAVAWECQVRGSQALVRAA